MKALLWVSKIDKCEMFTQLSLVRLVWYGTSFGMKNNASSNLARETKSSVCGSKVDHYVWGVDDAGSSPATPTKFMGMLVEACGFDSHY